MSRYVWSLSCSTSEQAINNTATKPQSKPTPVQPVKNEGKDEESWDVFILSWAEGNSRGSTEIAVAVSSAPSASPWNADHIQEQYPRSLHTRSIFSGWEANRSHRVRIPVTDLLWVHAWKLLVVSLHENFPFLVCSTHPATSVYQKSEAGEV